MKTPKGPILINLDESSAPAASPDRAPPVPDLANDAAPTGKAMQSVAALAVAKPSRLTRWFWSLLITLIGVVISINAWDFVTGLLQRSPILGALVSALLAALVAVLLGLALREMAAFSRLARIDNIHKSGVQALAEDDLGQARDVVAQMGRLYQNRSEVSWGRARMEERAQEQFDAGALLALAEIELLGPLDKMAMAEVENAARQVATVTAIVPLALADVATALFANIRMIRRIAQVYGGRSGALGSWRLTRAVLSHLVATGAVAVGDDLIGSIAGGGVLSKISRRFGEGVVNGALTARVGVAAMEVCRPLPFVRAKRPSVTRLVKRALAGLFGRG
ncbi:MAG: TIGR01620 family protein [Rhodobacterales bacterium]|nr:TIGR01620 family protein [Rhodobacterales bacterium]